MDKTFGEFKLKNQPANADMIVGFEASSNEEIRIPFSVFAESSGAAIVLQYSSNGTEWHNTYDNTDRYMRTKIGTENWSTAIPIGDNSVKLDNIPEIDNISDGYVVVVTSSGLKRISVVNLNSVLEINVPTKQYVGFVDEQDNQRVYFETAERFVSGTTELYLNGQRLYPSYDYEEPDNNHIKFLQYVPKVEDRIMLQAYLD